MKSPIADALQRHKVLILDGAMATELEKAGVDTANTLWSATALLDAPEKITAVHRSYFAAGARIATTNTYQANVQAFTELGLSMAAAQQLIRQAVRCAQQAAKGFDDVLIAGSVGPYGAYLADGSESPGRTGNPKARIRRSTIRGWRRWRMPESMCSPSRPCRISQRSRRWSLCWQISSFI